MTPSLAAVAADFSAVEAEVRAAEAVDFLAVEAAPAVAAGFQAVGSYSRGGGGGF